MGNTEARSVRIFLSSTFEDMQEERNHLIKKIFPSIKAVCRQRGVDFAVLDLRWGITAEEAASGRVIEICMNEIERTRPYFIGLLGGRYGWTPAEGDAAVTERLLNRYPWVRDDVRASMSITEMEMRFGALRNPVGTNALFYLRDLESVKKQFLEKPGSEKAARRDRLRGDILRAANVGRCSVAHYKSVKALGKRVHHDLMAMINAQFPPEQKPTRLMMASAEQAREFAELRKCYVGSTDAEVLRRKIFDSIKNGEPVVLYGAKGSGKSAFLVSNITDGAEECCGRYKVVHTIVGGVVASSDMAQRMLMYELAQTDPTIDLDELNNPESKPDYVRMLAARDASLPRVVWVLDGAGKLKTAYERSMAWANALLPHLAALVVATSDDIVGCDLLASGNRDVCRADMVPLSPSVIADITDGYLRDFAKGLSARQRAAIMNAPLFHNPGMLRIFLDELLQFGEYGRIDEFMGRYLETKSCEDVCGLVLGRIEADFGRDVIYKLLGMLRVVRYGIDEEAVRNGLAMGSVGWAAVRSSIERFCICSGGKIRLRDDDFIAAAGARYPMDDTERKHAESLAIELLSESVGRRRTKQGLRRYFSAKTWLWGVHPHSVMDTSDTFLRYLHTEDMLEYARLLLSSCRFREMERILNRDVYLMTQMFGGGAVELMPAIRSGGIDLTRLISAMDVVRLGIPYVSDLAGLKFSILKSTGQQQESLKRHINHMLLPSSMKRKALNLIDVNSDESRMSIPQLVELFAEGSMSAAVMLIGKCYSLLAVNTSLLDETIAIGNKVLQKPNLPEAIAVFVRCVCAMAYARKGEWNDADRMLAIVRLSDSTGEVDYIRYFLCAYVALRKYHESKNHEDKAEAVAAVKVFRRNTAEFSGTPEVDFMGTWIKELTEEYAVDDPMETNPDRSLDDVCLVYLAFGLDFDGVDAALRYLKMIADRESIDAQIRFFALCKATKYLSEEEGIDYKLRAISVNDKHQCVDNTIELEYAVALELLKWHRYKEFASMATRLLDKIKEAEMPPKSKTMLIASLRFGLGVVNGC